jgi:hypothetical protein
MHGRSVFSTLDLQSGYHQILIHPDDVPKAAFVSTIGQYQFKVLCFGLTNAPATFQRVMNSIFELYLFDWVVVYLDDICIMSRSLEEHAHHVQLAFQLLRKHSFFVDRKKCYFCKSQVSQLGHVVSSEGLRVGPAKTALVRGWPRPTSLRELQSFLGLASYFRRFIPGYSTIVAPLTSITSSSSPPFNFQCWPVDCPQYVAFEAIKQALTSPPLLAFPDPSKQFEVRSDASLHGIGAVLLQDGRPIACMSKIVTPAQRNYSTTDQKLLAVYHACKEWR